MVADSVAAAVLHLALLPLLAAALGTRGTSVLAAALLLPLPGPPLLMLLLLLAAAVPLLPLPLLPPLLHSRRRGRAAALHTAGL